MNKLISIIILSLIIIPITMGTYYRQTIWVSQNSFDRMMRDLDKTFELETAFCMTEFSNTHNVMLEYTRPPSKYMTRTATNATFKCPRFNYANAHSHPSKLCSPSDKDMESINNSRIRFGMIICSTNITDSTVYDEEAVYYYEKYEGGYHKFKTIDSE